MVFETVLEVFGIKGAELGKGGGRTSKFIVPTLHARSTWRDPDSGHRLQFAAHFKALVALVFVDVRWVST